jgi:putative membrane protein
MKRAAILTFLIGTAVIVAAIWAVEPRAVAAAVARVGWAILLVIGVRAIAVTFAGLCWWLLIPSEVAPRPRVCAMLRIVREGVNTLLPLTQVGGDVVAVRLLTFWGLAGPLAAATLLIDVLLQAATQFFFALTGLALLGVRGGSDSFVRDSAIALALAGLGLLGFYIVQRQWGEKLFTGLLQRIAGGREWAVHGTVETLFTNLHKLYARRGPLAASFFGHLAVWFIGAMEVWIALNAMGYEVTYSAALSIEGLAQAARGAAFAVPGAVGVQEAGLILLCGLFGIPAQSALALSLIKRAADIGVGGPGLIVWQTLEASRLAKKKAAAQN